MAPYMVKWRGKNSLSVHIENLKHKGQSVDMHIFTDYLFIHFNITINMTWIFRKKIINVYVIVFCLLVAHSLIKGPLHLFKN